MMLSKCGLTSLNMSKRTKYVIVSIILGILLYFSGMVGVESGLGLLLGIAGVAYFLCVWALFDDLKGIEWFTLMVLPVIFVIASGMFGTLLPNALPGMLGMTFSLETSQLLAGLLRVIYFSIVSFLIYGMLLVENIFSVASIRTIQLYRAAKSANIVFSLVTSMFFYSVALSLKLPFWVIGGISLLATFLISYPVYWGVDLKTPNLKEVRNNSLWTGWLTTIVAMALSFWPVQPFMGGLMLTSVLYVLIGVLEQKMSSKAYFESLLEYAITLLVIFVVGFLYTSWIGSY